MQTNLLTFIFFETSIAAKYNIINKTDIEKYNGLDMHKLIIKKLEKCDNETLNLFNELYATHMPSILYALKRSYDDIFYSIGRENLKSFLKTISDALQSE